MFIRTKTEDGKLFIKSGFHPLIPITLFFPGLFIVFLFTVTGLDSRAFPFFTSGKPLGILGLIPTIFFFVSITMLSYRNLITIDKNNILLKTGIFFLWNTQTEISTENCDGIILQPVKPGKLGLHFVQNNITYNTLLSGSEKKINEVFAEISKITGLKQLENIDKSPGFFSKSKIKIFMKQRENQENKNDMSC